MAAVSYLIISIEGNRMSDYHQQSSAEVMKNLNVTDQGLSDYDVQKRQEVYGYNVLKEGKNKCIRRFLWAV